MPITNFLGNEILNYNFLNAGYEYSPTDIYGCVYFGLSTSLVTAEDVACSTATEPGGSYTRATFFSGIPTMTVTGMTYTGKNVTLEVSSIAGTAIDAGDIVTVTGVDAGFSATNIDGTWVLTNYNISPDELMFTVANQPTGTPQTLTAGTVICANWSSSTDASLYNNKEVVFSGTGGGETWGPIVSIFIADDPTAGNILAFYTVPTPFTVPENTQPALPPKSIMVSQPTACGTLFTINRILNYNFSNVTYTPDDSGGYLWFGLSTTVVDDTGLPSVTEPPAAASYSRARYTDSDWFASTGVNPPSGIVNDYKPFPTVSGAWGVIRSLFIADSPTRGTGNILWYKTLSPSIYVPDGMIDVFFNSGEITFSMT